MSKCDNNSVLQWVKDRIAVECRFCIFNCDENFIKSVGHLSNFVRFSEIDNINIDYNDPIFIYQDLSLNEFKTRIHSFLANVFYRLWRDDLVFYFFSVLKKCQYRSLLPSDVHQNPETIYQGLYTEQMIDILDYCCLQISLPKTKPDHPIPQVIFENLLKDKKISFRKNHRINGFHIDYLIERDNKKYLVFINKNKALIRTRFASDMNTIIFSQSEIISEPNECLNRLKCKKQNLSLSFDSDLDPSQLKAKNHIHGPIRVLAPAGSGKTKTLINRILYLIQYGIPENKILALAFNTKAREEMQQRLALKNIHNVVVKTFHSFGYEIVRKKLNWSFDIKNEKRFLTKLLYQSLKEHKIIGNQETDLHPYLKAIKTTKLSLSHQKVKYNQSFISFQPIFKTFTRKQYNHKLLTFDDMIYIALKLLLKHSELRYEYKNNYEYILVDEFQDLNFAQLLLMDIIALPENNIFAVGDDDQLIYGWRGANVEHFIKFHKKYSCAQSCLLSTNYRSNKNIIIHAKRLIDKNKQRVYKNTRFCSDKPKGIFKIKLGKTMTHQTDFFIDWIFTLCREKNCQWQDFAILYRYNCYQYLIATELEKNKIPHTPVNYSHLFRSTVGFDIYAYLCIILSPLTTDSQYFKIILKRPNKLYSRKLISNVTNWETLNSILRNKDLREWEIKSLSELISNIKSLQYILDYSKPSAIDLINIIDDTFTLKDFYSSYESYQLGLDQSSDSLILDIIKQLACNFSDIHLFFDFIHHYITEEQIKDVSNLRKNQITLSSIHKAKGKEFKNVVYFNSSHRYKMTLETLEDERRVAYVAVTRSKENILITAPEKRPSPFLKELALNPKWQKYKTNHLTFKLNLIQTKLIIVKQLLVLKVVFFRHILLFMVNNDPILNLFPLRSKLRSGRSQLKKEQSEIQIELKYRRMFNL